MTYILSLADPQATLETVGGKGASLARLAQAGLPVPEGFHITTGAYDRFVADNDLRPRLLAAAQSADPAQPATLEAAAETIHALFAQAALPTAIAAAIHTAYLSLSNVSLLTPNSQLAVAVRSSATAEDLPDLSFAGQQETFLNVSGNAAVQAAVKRCWASLWTARAIGYRAQHAIDHTTVSLAVVVQRMVPAEMAGVLFTANPLNANRAEVVINATWGLGEALVGGLVSPDTIIADKPTGAVKHMEIADKAVMTTPTATGTAEQPVAAPRRRERVLNDAQIAALVRLGVQIEQLYGTPQDIEWCWAGTQGFIVQARPITTLDKAAPVAPPTLWKVPRGAKYMRNNIVELLPDPLTPLFGTLGRRVINAELTRLMELFLGAGLTPDELIVTVNDYAYNGGAFTARQIWGILMGSVGIAKRMFTGAIERWHAARVTYQAVVAEWAGRPWREFSTPDLLHSLSVVMGAAIAYYGAAVSGLIPAAWISEGLFTVAYNRLLKRKDDPAAPVYLLGFDSLPILAEKELYDLAQWTRGHPDLLAHLRRTPAARLAAALTETTAPLAVEGAAWHEWQQRFGAYLQRYGSTIYDLDFAKPTPADAPIPTLEVFKLFLQNDGADEPAARDPHARQQAAAARREAAIQTMTARLQGWRLRLFQKYLARAQKYAPQRENCLAEVGLGYPLVRQMLLEVGRRLVAAGAIAQTDDIFWLLETEVEQTAAAVERGASVASLGAAVRQRQAVWEAEKRVTPPVSLPLPPKFLLKFLPAAFGGQTELDGRATSGSIKGTPCSPGVVTGIARVLNGPQDFDQMRPGDVLVAAITTPAWTPLFAMAAAIVTDVGGPLSHGSIVAREYAIPAVLGTGVATRRIHTGDRVRVDGARGVVEVLVR